MEIWKDIKGYEGLYQVSNLGRVKSLPKVDSKYCKEKLLKSHTNKITGYSQIILCKDAKRHCCYIHRLVAETFIANPNNKLEVNHISGIKEDNRVENLEWSTRQENVVHSYKKGLRKTRRITQYDKQGNFIKCWDSIQQASKTLNIFPSRIGLNLKNKCETAGGFIWRYADN